ncbi:hypothetical protein CU098_006722, partial [Rhizopus stolonifer]
EFHGQGRFDHMGIFVPNEGEGDVGTLYHVVGSAPLGFKKGVKKNYNLMESASYISNSKKFQFEIDESTLINAISMAPEYPPVTLKEAKSGNFKNCRTWVND